MAQSTVQPPTMISDRKGNPIQVARGKSQNGLELVGSPNVAKASAAQTISTTVLGFELADNAQDTKRVLCVVLRFSNKVRISYAATDPMVVYKTVEANEDYLWYPDENPIFYVVRDASDALLMYELVYAPV